MFGSMEDDDVDCLFYIYARFLTDRQEGTVITRQLPVFDVHYYAGVLCITFEKNELSEVHSRLMAQNVSLHALLEATHQSLCHAAPN